MFEALLAIPGLYRVVHFEPVGWQRRNRPLFFTKEAAVVRAARESALQLNYNRNLLSIVDKLAADKKIRVENIKYDFSRIVPIYPARSSLGSHIKRNPPVPTAPSMASSVRGWGLTSWGRGPAAGSPPTTWWRRPMKAAIPAGFLILAFVAVTAAAESLPSFKVATRDLISVCGLVPPGTTEQQLKMLVHALRDARRAGTLRERFGIQPTTPGGVKGPYGNVSVYIFSEPRWCSSTDFKAGIWARGGSALDEAFTMATRATYTYGVRPGQPDFEEGTIGASYVDRNAKRVYTKPHEKLF